MSESSSDTARILTNEDGCSIDTTVRDRYLDIDAELHSVEQGAGEG